MVIKGYTNTIELKITYQANFFDQLQEPGQESPKNRAACGLL